jgi:hypothetical protein
MNIDGAVLMAVTCVRSRLIAVPLAATPWTRRSRTCDAGTRRWRFPQQDIWPAVRAHFPESPLYHALI